MKQLWQKQWANPAGLWGHVAGYVMQKRNFSLNMRAFEALVLEGVHSILDIGCGPGVLLEKLIAETEKSYVVGVDPSPVMLKQAARRNAQAVDQGIILLEPATADDLPFQSMAFDRIITVDTYPYLQNARDDFLEIQRVLQPGGQFVLGVYVPTEEADNVLQSIKSYLNAAQLRYVGAEHFPQRGHTEIVINSTR